MLIQFHCRNSVFDPGTGRQTVCGSTVTAQSSQAGHLVSCPKCDNQCEVPLESSEVERKRPDENGSEAPSGKTRKKKNKESSNPSKQPAAAMSSSDSGEFGLSDVVDRPQSDVMSMDFKGKQKKPAPTLTKDRSKRCPECGKKVDDRGYCSACKKAERRFEKADMELEDVPMELAGFQLWFANIANEGVSISVLAYVFHGLLTAFTVSLVVLGLVAIQGFLGVFVAIFSLCMFALYVALCFKGYQFTRNPHARLAWFQKPFWNGILMLTRMMKWQAYDGKLKDRTIVDVRNKPITDEKLVRLEGFKAAQVLDLEGTLITDEVMRTMYKLKNLRCVVLKNTSVSHESVTKLQQSIPRLWIWY